MDKHFLRNVLLKGLGLFLVFNLLMTQVNISRLGTYSLYDHLFRGRERFPFGENPTESYNFSLYNLYAMFESLAIDAQEVPVNEFRVIVIGDSSTWGTLLRPEETLAGQLDALGLSPRRKKGALLQHGIPNPFADQGLDDPGRGDELRTRPHPLASYPRILPARSPVGLAHRSQQFTPHPGITARVFAEP